MTVEEMLKLIDAGFTAEELRAMKNAPAPEPTPEPAPAEPAPEPTPEPAPAEPAPEEPKEDPLAPILKELQDLRKAVYGMNILNSSQPAPKSADDVLENLMKGNR